jgi:cation diffusion facilitator family transporter
MINSKKTNSRKNKLLLAVLFCFTLFLIQLVGGYLSGSLALMADAYHMLSDVFGYSVSLASIHLACLPKCHSFSLGYKRVEVLGAFCSIILVWFLSFGLILEAVQRFYNPQDINARYMLLLAVIAVCFNGLLIGVFGLDFETQLDHYESIKNPNLEEEMVKRNIWKNQSGGDLNIRVYINII